MAMEINGLHYGSYGPQGAAGNGTVDGTKRKEPEKAQETAGNNRPRNEAGNNRPRNTAEYASELAKLVPSVEFKVGSTFASNKKGKTLTVDPRLLEKMQNDPEKEKEMKELIRGVVDLCQYFGQKKLKDYAAFLSSSSSFCWGVI